MLDQLTVNSRKGLYQFNCPPHGITSAPVLFQAVINKVLITIKNVGSYIDDVVIAGKDANACYKTLYIVLKRLSEHITLTTEICKFLQSSVHYMSHQIRSGGMYLTKGKVRAVKIAPSPAETRDRT